MNLRKKRLVFLISSISTGVVALGCLISGTVISLGFVDNLSTNVKFASIQNDSNTQSAPKDSTIYEFEFGYGRKNAFEIKNISSYIYNPSTNDTIRNANFDINNFRKIYDQKINSLKYNNIYNNYVFLYDWANQYKNEVNTQINNCHTYLNVAFQNNKKGIITQIQDKNALIQSSKIELADATKNQAQKEQLKNQIKQLEIEVRDLKLWQDNYNFELTILNSQVKIVNEILSVNARYLATFPLIAIGCVSLASFIVLLILLIITNKKLENPYNND